MSDKTITTQTEFERLEKIEALLFSAKSRCLLRGKKDAANIWAEKLYKIRNKKLSLTIEQAERTVLA